MSTKHLTKLHVVFYHKATGSYPSNESPAQYDHGDIRRGKEKLKHLLGTMLEWEIAYLYDSKTNYVLCAFHPSQGTNELTRVEAEHLRKVAKQALQGKIKAYMVPSLEEQVKGAKPITKWVDSPEQAKQLLQPTISHIILYKDGGKIGQVSHNGLLK